MEVNQYGGNFKNKICQNDGTCGRRYSNHSRAGHDLVVSAECRGYAFSQEY